VLPRLLRAALRRRGLSREVEHSARLGPTSTGRTHRGRRIGTGETHPWCPGWPASADRRFLGLGRRRVRLPKRLRRLSPIRLNHGASGAGFLRPLLRCSPYHRVRCCARAGSRLANSSSAAPSPTAPVFASSGIHWLNGPALAVASARLQPAIHSSWHHRGLAGGSQAGRWLEPQPIAPVAGRDLQPQSGSRRADQELPPLLVV